MSRSILFILLLFNLTVIAQNGLGLRPLTTSESVKLIKDQKSYIGAGANLYEASLKEFGSSNASHFDLRDVGGITEAKEQGNCGSCWAFAAISAIESSNLLVNGEKLDLSEQQLLNCVRKPGDEDWGGCNGGNANVVFRWMIDNQYELNQEYQQDYQGTRKNCMVQKGKNIRLVNFKMMDRYVSGKRYPPSINEIKDAIVKHGAITAEIFVNQDKLTKEAYVSGIFMDENTSDFRINHAISIVGWDDNKGAWLIKNSWTTWGDKGFGWVGYNKQNIKHFVWIDVAKNDSQKKTDNIKIDENLLVIDFTHTLGSLQEYEKLTITIDGAKQKRFGMNKKGVKYHNKIYLPKGKHKIELITESVISKEGKKSMLFGKGILEIDLTESQVYNLHYAKRIKDPNVFELVLK